MILFSQRVSCRGGSGVRCGGGTARAYCHVVDGPVRHAAGVAATCAERPVEAVPADRVVVGHADDGHRRVDGHRPITCRAGPGPGRSADGARGPRGRRGRRGPRALCGPVSRAIGMLRALELRDPGHVASPNEGAAVSSVPPLATTIMSISPGSTPFMNCSRRRRRLITRPSLRAGITTVVTSRDCRRRRRARRAVANASGDLLPRPQAAGKQAYRAVYSDIPGMPIALNYGQFVAM
jgi:hypothetical protein